MPFVGGPGPYGYFLAQQNVKNIIQLLNNSFYYFQLVMQIIVSFYQIFVELDVVYHIWYIIYTSVARSEMSSAGDE